jgi:hypothetical protein
MAELTFFIDDSANATYTGADGLAWKGSFNYDATTNSLAFDAAWGGPYPLLYDDGPTSTGGHEPAGATAGDHVWSVTVGLAPPASDLVLEYGAIRGSVSGSDGEWIWLGANGSVTVPSGETGRVNATGLVLPTFGTIDLRVELDGSNLNPTFTGTPLTQVMLKTGATGWQDQPMRDDGTMGDLTAGDGIFTYVLSQSLPPHVGLLHLDDDFAFVLVLDGVEYRADDGQADTTGVSAWSDAANPGSDACLTATTDCVAETITASSESLVVVGAN